MQNLTNISEEKKHTEHACTASCVLNKNRQINVHFCGVLWTTSLCEHEKKFVKAQKKGLAVYFLCTFEIHAIFT